MASTLLLILICVSCLMFLGMLYGEKLNLLGLSETLWTMPVGDLFEKMWNGVTQAVDDSIEFVLAHLSWVVAAVSGTAGLLLIIFLMGGGLAADAAEAQRDALQPLGAGGVIDQIPEVAARTSQNAVQLADAELDDTHFVTQAVSREYVVFGRPEYAPIRPRPRRPIEGGTIGTNRPLPKAGRSNLDVTFRRLGSSILSEPDIPDTSFKGVLEDSWPDPRFVDRAVTRLLTDNWQQSSGVPANPDDGIGLPGDVVMESPASAVRELESRVRFTPGLLVAEHDVRVEKSFPDESATGEITIEISITNMSSNIISGLLVRELLPTNTLVRGANPDGVLRADTMTWLIDDLRPADVETLRFTVLPDRTFDRRLGQREFESLTEISAITAVATQTRVEDEQPLPEPFPSDRNRPRLPPIAGRPDLRMTIAEPDADSKVGSWTKLRFTIRNVGTAAAETAVIRLQLDPELDHHALLRDTNPEREVFVSVRRLDAGESREFDLEVRPRSAGEIQSTAELLLDDAQVGLRTFRIVARDEDDRPPFDSDSAIQ